METKLTGRRRRGPVCRWGSDVVGQLENDTPTDASTAVLAGLPSDVDVTPVAASGDTSLALTSAGSVYAWGGAGQLGDGSDTNSDVPVEVQLPSGVIATQIAEGYRARGQGAISSSRQAARWSVLPCS